MWYLGRSLNNTRDFCKWKEHTWGKKQREQRHDNYEGLSYFVNTSSQLEFILHAVKYTDLKYTSR